MTRLAVTCVILFYTFCPLTDTEGIYPVCCENVSGECKHACHEITLIDLATKPERHKLFTAHLEQHCEGSNYLREFMRCFNNTTRELQRGSNWHGRECCVFARDTRCRVACIYAQSIYELEPVCFPGKETGLFKCFQAREDADRCCKFGSTANGSSACESFCMELLPASVKPPVFTYGDLILLHGKCSDSTQVVHCTWDLGKAPDNQLECQHCCSAAPNVACRAACKEVASRRLSGVPAIEMLISSGCGPPVPAEAFWTCLLKSLDAEKSTTFISPSKVHSNPDSLKLHCCMKAKSLRCRTLCFQSYDSVESASYSDDDLFWDCLEEESEVELRACYYDVSEPCQMGCSDLRFCSHFNDPQANSFRSCDIANDARAQAKFDSLVKEGRIFGSNGSLTMSNFNKDCSAIFRGILCHQYIQPCQALTWDTMPCRNNCISHASKCLPPEEADDVCLHMFPEDSLGEHCPLIQVPVPRNGKVIKLPEDHSATPCHPSPCLPNEHCHVRRTTERHSNSKYECVQGCVVSRESTGLLLVVAQGDQIILPYLGNNDRICYQTCHCTGDGMMTGCEDLDFCELPEGCSSDTTFYDHGSSFQKACTYCACLAGETICTAGYCLTEAQRGEERTALTGLPCSCPTSFSRVCGHNGKTYPTECSARCAGLMEDNFGGGSCSLDRVCPHNYCGPSKWCVELSEVCLDDRTKCLQHACVDIRTDCALQPVQVACDADGNEHPNLCSLLLAGKRFDYIGKCMSGCSTSGPVCGQNSENFPSECAALADRVGTDYKGKCITIGGRIEEGLLNTCLVAYELCTPKELPDCISVVPPDACCPVCAGGLRVLFSRRRLHQLTEKHIMTTTSRELLTELQRVIQSSSCQVLGYMTLVNDIAILVQRINYTHDGQNLLEEHTICVREAERLHYLINTQSPLITMNARLWPLASSRIIHVAPLKSTAVQSVIVEQAQIGFLFFWFAHKIL